MLIYTLHFVLCTFSHHRKEENKKSLRARKLQLKSCGLGKSFNFFGFHFWHKVGIQQTEYKIKISKCCIKYYYGNKNDQKNCHPHLSSNFNLKFPVYRGCFIFVTEKIWPKGILSNIKKWFNTVPRKKDKLSYLIFRAARKGKHKYYIQNLTSNRTPSGYFPVNQTNRIDVSSFEGLKDIYIHCIIKHFRGHIPSKTCTFQILCMTL